MGFSEISTISYGGTRCPLSQIIESNTSPQEFEGLCSEWNGYTLKSGDISGNTALGLAAFKGNAELITHIAIKGDKFLFYLANRSGQTPLHLAIDCENKEAGYLAAKALVQSGSPINIVKRYNFLGHPHFEETPLEKALNSGHTKIAALLLRMGGIARPDKINVNGQESLISAAKEIITKNENLFNMRFQKEIPMDVMNHIMLISAMV